MAYHFDEKGSIKYHAIREIKTGQEITYAYVDLYQSHLQRRAKLITQYHIPQCLCERCVRPVSDQPFEKYLCGHVCPACRPNPYPVPRFPALPVDEKTGEMVAVDPVDEARMNHPNI